MVLSSSCIISFSGTFLKYAMSLCWESGGRWQSARWSWQGPRGEEAHRETLPPAATLRARCPSSPSYRSLTSRERGWQANGVLAKGLGQAFHSTCGGVTDDWGSQTTSEAEPETKEHKVRTTEQTAEWMPRAENRERSGTWSWQHFSQIRFAIPKFDSRTRRRKFNKRTWIASVNSSQGVLMS